MKSSKLSISKLLLPAPVVILLGFDIFYWPNANDNLELIGYPLMIILMLLAFTLLFLTGGLLDKTKKARDTFKYGVGYACILMVEIFIVIYRMFETVFTACMQVIQ